MNLHEWPLHVCIYLIRFVLNNNIRQNKMLYMFNCYGPVKQILQVVSVSSNRVPDNFLFQAWSLLCEEGQRSKGEQERSKLRGVSPEDLGIQDAFIWIFLACKSRSSIVKKRNSERLPVVQQIRKLCNFQGRKCSLCI